MDPVNIYQYKTNLQNNAEWQDKFQVEEHNTKLFVNEKLKSNAMQFQINI